MELVVVTPIYKVKKILIYKSILEVSNYRPVSVPPILGKFLEKLMFDRLVNFLEKCEIIYEHQYGFQKASPKHILAFIFRQEL